MTTTVRSGIPTKYRSTRFRSRLESRWAAFFDLVGWQWIYEPLDADGYIPDFLITGPASFLVEVGPCEHLSDFSAKAAKPLAAFPGVPPEYVTLIVGLSPDILDPNDMGRAGYLTSDGGNCTTAPACWGRCKTCGAIGIYHEYGDYRLRPCGHGGDGSHLDFLAHAELFDWWAIAGNRVQWRR